MRYTRYLLLAALAVVLITVAIANRAPVTLNALPPDMAAFASLHYALSIPLYLVIFGSIVVGLMIGFVWEWFREHRIRATSSTRAREITRLERELEALRKSNPAQKDDVLALLERPAKAG
nr:lipopolysaccharide assembly protein LapA domain-containing protein [Pseudorhodobacter wandonensis]